MQEGVTETPEQLSASEHIAGAGKLLPYALLDTLQGLVHLAQNTLMNVPVCMGEKTWQA